MRDRERKIWHLSYIVFTPSSPNARESKTVLNSGFRAVDFGLQIMDSGFFVCGTWIPDCNRLWDSDSSNCIPVSGFQSTGLRIPQAKISLIPDSLTWSDQADNATVTFAQWSVLLSQSHELNKKKDYKLNGRNKTRYRGGASCKYSYQIKSKHHSYTKKAEWLDQTN